MGASLLQASRSSADIINASTGKHINSQSASAFSSSNIFLPTMFQPVNSSSNSGIIYPNQLFARSFSRIQQLRQIPPAVSVNRRPVQKIEWAQTPDQVQPIIDNHGRLMKMLRRQLRVQPKGKLRRYLRSQVEKQKYLLDLAQQHLINVEQKLQNSQLTEEKSTSL
jgi:hypothetical protein